MQFPLTAIDVEFDAGDVRRVIGGEEDHRHGDLRCAIPLNLPMSSSATRVLVNDRSDSLQINEGQTAHLVPFNRNWCRQRNIIDQLIGWLEENCRVFSHFEKTAINFSAG